MTTVPVKDASDNTVNIQVPDLGRAAAADSIPYAMSSEDKAVLDSIVTLLTTQAGYLDGVETALGLVGTQTTAAAILAKLTADPATQTTLAAIAALLTTQNGYLDGLEALAAAATPAGANLIGKVGIDQTTPGTTDRVSAGDTAVIDVTLSLDTSAYASGDLLADTQVVTNAMRVNDFGGFLQNITVIDKDDQGVAFDIYILDANVTMGTENAAPSISDANAASILCKIPVLTTDYYDLGGVKVADINNLARAVKPATGTRNLYVAVVNGTGTPTFTASGVVLRLGFGRD